MIIVSINQVILPSFLPTMIKGDEWKRLTPEKIEFMNAQIAIKDKVSVVSTYETKSGGASEIPYVPITECSIKISEVERLNS